MESQEYFGTKVRKAHGVTKKDEGEVITRGASS